MTNPLPLEIKASDIEAGHLAIGIWNGKTGADSKQGVKHLYSEAYEKMWPREEYPAHYQEDVPVD